jgi:hypothetical protein
LFELLQNEPNCDRKKAFYFADRTVAWATTPDGGHAGDGTLGLWPVKELLTKEESETIEDIDIGARASNSLTLPPRH